MERTVKIKKLSNLIRRKLSAIDKDSQSSHYRILIFINDSKETIYQKDIDKYFSMQRPTTTQILKIMERDGYIVKKGSEQDRRLKSITITKKGKDYVEQVRNELEDMEKRFVKGISDKDLAICDKVISKMIENGEELWYKL